MSHFRRGDASDRRVAGESTALGVVVTKTNMRSPDGVREIADVWGTVSRAVHSHAGEIRSLRLGPASFGAAYVDQMADVHTGVNKIADTWAGWSKCCNTHGSNLHSAVDLYVATDEGSAAKMEHGR